MTPFNQAWQVLKMARYKVGPTEFWDRDEPIYSGKDEEDKKWFDGKGFPQTRDLGEKPSHWKDDWHDWESKRIIPNYFPMGGSPWFGRMAGKVMMRPSDFLSLASSSEPGYYGADEKGNLDISHYLESEAGKGIEENMRAGVPTFIPNLSVSRGNVIGHEGRHRMAAVHNLMGDEPVPVQISTDDYYDNRGHRGEYPHPATQEMMDDLVGVKLRGQYDEERNLELTPEMFRMEGQQ
jgi:hypothetical protein